MINLIPPHAKKSVLIEYWLRVLSSWFIVWSIALVVGIVILIPSYVLIADQVKVYSSDAKAASEKIVDYKGVTKDLTQSSQQAVKLLGELKEPLISDYLLLFKNLESKDVVISKITVQRTDKGIGAAQITGEATDRQSLATFRDRLLSQSEIAGVDLPISNLAKDKDLKFTLTVTFNKITP